MNAKQKIARLTKVQFYYQQTEERRKNSTTKKVMTHQLFNSPQKSQRVFLKSKLDFSSTKLGDSSCCCSDCGKESTFKQRMFKIYPFNGSQQYKQQKQNENKIRDRYRNAKYIPIFRKLVNCLLFIIRYKVVQNIRNRQRQRMKRVLKTRIDKPRMTFLNVLEIATKKFHVNPKFKSASNFEFDIGGTAVNSPQDSDEEFYHLKPRKSLIRKNSSEELYPQKKLSKYQQKVYLITGPNSVLNNYVTEKLNKTPNKSKSQNTTCLPPLLSLTVSPRINPQSHFPHIRIKHI